MKSTLRVDFLDRGEGKGLEAVIKVNLIGSDDPRDKLLKSLFQAEGDVLKIEYIDHKHTVTKDSLPAMEKTLILYK